MPLFSIITVNLNDRAGLARTLESVGRQTFRDRESVVVDGGSTDGSLEVIREHASTVTDFVSEKDRGVYDAMNKGIARAKGEYLVFMNGGDTFLADDSLERLAAAGPMREDIVYADVIFVNPDGEREHWPTPEVLDWDFFMKWNLPHQAVAFRRDLFERVGPYDIRFKICGDLEFFLRAIVMRGASTRHVPLVLAVQMRGGLSSSDAGFPRHREERKLARETALSPVLLAHWEQYLEAKRGFLHHTVRNAFRPLTRRMRSFSRRLRKKPDSLV